MSFYLAAYEDPQAAHRAVEALQRGGVPREALKLHLNKTQAAHPGLASVDEQVSGGLGTNLFSLFDDVFEWGSLPIDASPYAALVRRGGAVVGIDSTSEDIRRAASDALAQAPRADFDSGWVVGPGGEAKASPT